MKSRRAIAAAVCAAALALPSCSVKLFPTDQPTRPPRGLPGSERQSAATRQIEKLLSQRLERLKAKDVDGFLEASAPAAQAFERPIIQGALAVPLANPRLELKKGSPKGSQFPLSGVGVTLSYAYEGLAASNRFSIHLNYDLARQGDGIQVTSASPQEGATLPFWATGPVQTLRSEHFLALFRPNLQKAGDTVNLAEQARARLQPKLTLPLEKAHLLVLARDEGEYQQASANSPLTSVAQARASFKVTPTSIDVEGRQIIVNMERLYREASELETLQHELGHLALFEETRPFTPAWVGEAAAMFLAGTRPVKNWQSDRPALDALSFGRLTATAGLGQHDPTGEAASVQYAYSAAAAWYLVETYGDENFWKFYRSYASVPAAQLYKVLPSGTGGDGDAAVLELASETTESSLEKIFGFGQDELDIRVKQWISKQTR